jgi:hypothetical protein
MRPRHVWIGVLLVVVIVGGLRLLDHVQADAQEQQLTEQQQRNAAVSTQDVRASGAHGLCGHAAVPIDAQATQSLATLTAYRASVDATVAAACQISARATNTRSHDDSRGRPAASWLQTEAKPHGQNVE